MWVGTVAVGTTFRDLQASIRSINPELPVTFEMVEYPDYRQQHTPRFRSAPIFHKRVEYRGEDEVRAGLPKPNETVIRASLRPPLALPTKLHRPCSPPLRSWAPLLPSATLFRPHGAQAGSSGRSVSGRATRKLSVFRALRSFNSAIVNRLHPAGWRPVHRARCQEQPRA